MTTYLHYDLRLHEPACLHEVGLDPNVMETERKVSGARIRGVLATRWLRTNPVDDPANDDTFRRLFLSGACRFGDALPASRDGSPQIPTPCSVRVPKGNAGAKSLDAFDFAAEPEERRAERRIDYKPIGDGYAFVKPEPEGRWTTRTPATRRQMHHKRDRGLGRPNDGNIYFIEALGVGERFAGTIEADDRDDLDTLLQLLRAGDSLRLGRAAGTGYGGRAKVLESKIAERPRHALPRDPGDHLVVTLLSPLIARDPDTGDLSSDAQRVLLPLLGAALASRGPAPIGLPSDPGAMVAFARTRVLEGWVNAWHGRRPLARVLDAGSTFVFPDVPAPRAAFVFSAGERTEEGFGLVAVGLHGTATSGESGVIIHPAETDSPHDPETISGDARNNFLAALQERWCIENAPSTALAIARSPGGVADSSRRYPNRTALAAARTALRKAGESGRRGGDSPWRGISTKSQSDLNSFRLRNGKGLLEAIMSLCGGNDPGGGGSLCEYVMKEAEGTSAFPFANACQRRSLLDPGAEKRLGRAVTDHLLLHLRRLSANQEDA